MIQLLSLLAFGGLTIYSSLPAWTSLYTYHGLLIIPYLLISTPAIFYKPRRSNHNSPVWPSLSSYFQLKQHKRVHVWSILFLLLSLLAISGSRWARGKAHLVSWHAVIGSLALLLLLGQVFISVMWRRMPLLMHRWGGYGIAVLMWISATTGAKKEFAWDPRVLYVLSLVWLVGAVLRKG